MVQLQQEIKKIEAAGIQVVGISYDSQEILKKFAEQGKITFPLLSDVKSETIDAYGIRNKEVKAGSRQDGVPHPGTFLIDRNGIVRAKIFYTIRKRHDADELIKTAEKIR